MALHNASDISFVAADWAAPLEALAADLRRIGSGQAPTAEDLADAPLFLSYRLAHRPATCLRGHAIGHPLVAGPDIFTSQLWAISTRHGWARTTSRFYQLGNFIGEVGR
jgi:hypothetical protein